jgi:hypothetical protein
MIADDQRRWPTGTSAACGLLGITPAALPWRTMDDFTPAGDLSRLEEQWQAFLRRGEAAGGYELYVPDRGPVPAIAVVTDRIASTKGAKTPQSPVSGDVPF